MQWFEERHAARSFVHSTTLSLENDRSPLLLVVMRDKLVRKPLPTFV